MEISTLFGLGSIPVIIALVEVLKRSWTDCPKEVYPVLSIFLGVAFNVYLGSVLHTDANTSIILGLVAGLSAAGTYSSVKSMAGR